MMYGWTLAPDKKLQAILQSEPTCTAPCWRNLTPGMTEDEFHAERETDIIIHYLGLRKTTHSPELTCHDSAWHWIDLSTGLEMSAYFRNNNLIGIGFSSNKLTLDLVTIFAVFIKP